MKKKAVFSIAIMLIATSLVSARNNNPIALEFAIDQAVKQEITSLVRNELPQDPIKLHGAKNWLKNEPLDYFRNRQVNIYNLENLIDDLKNERIDLTDVDHKQLFDVFSYLMVYDKTTFVKFINTDNWLNNDSPLSYIAELEPKRTLLTQAVLLDDEELLKEIWNKIPKRNREELVVVTLENLIKLPNPSDTLLDKDFLKKEIKRLEELLSVGADYHMLKDANEGQQVASLIENDWKQLERYKAELKKIEDVEKDYSLFKHPTHVHLAHYVIDGDLRGLTVAYGYMNTSEKINKSYAALEYLIDYKKLNKQKK